MTTKYNKIKNWLENIEVNRWTLSSGVIIGILLAYGIAFLIGVLQ